MGFIQIFGICVAAFLWFKAIQRFKQKRMPLSEFIIWSSIWAGIIVVGFLPITVSFVAKLFGIGRGIDVAVYLSIIVLFYLVFVLFSRIDKQREEITKLVREIALKKK